MLRDARTWRNALTVTLVIGLLSAGIVLDAKPPGDRDKPPKDDPIQPAPGTILFEQVYNPGEPTYYYEGWSMEADGSGKDRVLPPEFFDGIVNEAQGLTPSESVYGGDPLFDRWWLGARNLGPDATGWDIYELVARRPVDNGDGTLSVTEVQLTNFGVEIRVGLGSGCRPEWSNDGLDSFVSFKGVDIEWSSEGEPSLLATRLYRLNISGSDIDTAAIAGADLLIGPENLLLESVVSTPNGYEGNFTEHHWDPTGREVIYTLLNLDQDPDDTSGQEDVYLTKFDQNGTEIGTDLLWNSISSFGVGNVRWSPDGAKIAVTDFGDVWTVNPDDPSDFIVVVDGISSTLPCRNAYWSPDSLELVYNEERYSNKKGGTWEYQIYRVAADGGEPISVSGDLDKNQRNSIFGWVPFPEL